MIKILRICICLFLWNLTLANAQKPPIDAVLLNNWKSVSDQYLGLSADGKKLYYLVTKRNSENGFTNTLGIKWLYNSTERLFGLGYNNADITVSNDSKQLFCSYKDTLLRVNLETKSYVKLPGVKSVSLEGNYLVYEKVNENMIYIESLNTGKIQAIRNCMQYWTNRDKNTLVISKRIGSRVSLSRCDLATGRLSEFWQGERLIDLLIDNYSKTLAITVANKIDKQLLIFDRSDKLRFLFKENDFLSKDYKDFRLSGIGPFSIHGDVLQVQLERKVLLPQSVDSPNSLGEGTVKVWNFLNSRTEPTMVTENREDNLSITALIDITSRKISWIGPGMELKGFNRANYIARETLDDKIKYENIPKIPFQFISRIDNTTHSKSISFDGYPVISPCGKYIIWHSQSDKRLMCFEVASGKRVELISSVNSMKYLGGQDYDPDISSIFWLEDNREFVMRYQYDLWQFDASGKKPPINLTNWYGLQHKMRFENINPRKLKYADNEVIITGQNVDTKDQGVFTVKLGISRTPKVIDYGQWTYQNYDFKKGVWAFIKSNGHTSPNVFLKKPSKDLEILTDVRSEKNYNWLTQELISWKRHDGEISHGILYKPENFDPSKKYSLIFSLYENVTSQFNQFPLRQYGYGGDLDIPWFVSRGYLVLTPDIPQHPQPGQNATNALNIVNTGIEFVSSFKYVDKEKIGIAGHSYGGFETNYIITHSNKFAAAYVGAGQSDLVSQYLFTDQQYKMEVAQQNMQQTLWEEPSRYLNSSPVLFAHKVTTPLLLMHNKSDNAVPYAQGIEMYNALLRLGKPVWMLEYPNSGHVTFRNDTEDLTIRMQQFFDHFLKREKPPIWMTTPNSRSTSLDKLNEAVPSSLLAEEEKQKFDRLSDKTHSTIILK